MSKLHNDIRRMKRMIKIINQYNNFRQLGIKEDIDFLNEKIENLLDVKNPQKLIEDFKWCAKMCNMFYDEIEPEFKKQILKEENEQF